MEHDNNLQELDTLSNWELEDSDQDIRGRPLVASDGKRIGEIDDLLVDKTGERVAAIRLDDGRCCRVESLEIHPDKVVYRPAGAGVAPGTVAGHHGDRRHRDQVIPVVEEELVVGKAVREGGSIRVTSRVVTDTVGENVVLRKEHVNVERRDVNREVDPRDADALFKDQTISATERSETAVVGKKATVTGEVAVSKDVDVERKRVEGEVRHTEVEVDRTAADTRNRT